MAAANTDKKPRVRKSKNDSVTAQVVMKRGDYEAIRQEAKKAGVSFSGYVKMILANRSKEVMELKRA